MNERQINLAIPDQMLYDLSPGGIKLYLTLQSMSPYSDLLIDRHQISFQYWNKITEQSRDLKAITEALEELCEFKVLSRYDSKRYVLKAGAFDFEEGEFFRRISLNNFRAIRNKEGLLKHYFIMVRSFNWNIEVCGHKGIIGTMPISYFADRELVSEATIMRYNKQLEDLHIIYISRSKFNGEARETNVYALYENRGLVDKFAGYYNRSNSEQANKDRSLSMRYSHFIKAPEKYSEDERRQLIRDVEEYNARMDELAKLQPDFKLRMKALDIIKDA